MREDAAVELHDSTLREIVQEAEGVLLRLAPAYVHRSSGRPGFDPGTGWSQCVSIRLKGALIAGPPVPPTKLSEGTLEVAEQRYSNVIPLPLSAYSGAVCLSLQPEAGPLFVLRGTAIEVLPEGEATFIENT